MPKSDLGFLPTTYLDIFRYVPNGVGSVLDVGIGWGINGALLRTYADAKLVDAVEIFKPYIAHAARYNLYDQVYEGDIRTVLPTIQRHYDIVLCTETLEHISMADIPDILHHLERLGDRIIISSNNHFEESEAWDGNDYQLHRSLFSITRARSEGYRCLGTGRVFNFGAKKFKALFGRFYRGYVGVKDVRDVVSAPRSRVSKT